MKTSWNLDIIEILSNLIGYTISHNYIYFKLPTCHDTYN